MAGRKVDYLHIRADQRLKDALDQAAERGGRSVAEQARYLLEIILHLREPERLELPGSLHPEKKTPKRVGHAS